MKVSALIAIFLGAVFSRAQDRSVFGPPLDIRDNRELGNFNNVFVAETPSPKVKPPAIGSCGGTFTKSSGTIASPNYPDEAYPTDVNCTWLIEVQEGKVMTFKFNYMDIEVDPPECPFDGLLILDYGEIEKPEDIESLLSGGIMSNPVYPPTVIGGKRFCGTEQFDPVKSISNTVFVYFYSDQDSNGEGFVIEWEEVDTPKAEYECDFENGLCPGWINTKTKEDDFDWKVGPKENPTPETGPSEDHTLESADGKYLYIDAVEQSENQTAIFSSAEILFLDSEKLKCLEFWYHMRGSDINTLAIGYAIGEERELVWSQVGNQGNEWVQQTIEIEKMSTPFRIMFVGIRGDGDLGDIALDDIKLHNNPCQEIGAVKTTTISDLLPPTDYDTTTSSFTTDYSATTYDWSEYTGMPPIYYTTEAFESTAAVEETTPAIDETTFNDVTTAITEVTTFAGDKTTTQQSTTEEYMETTVFEETTATTFSEETTAEAATGEELVFTSEAETTTQQLPTAFEFTTPAATTTEAEQTSEQTTFGDKMTTIPTTSEPSTVRSTTLRTTTPRVPTTTTLQETTTDETTVAATEAEQTTLEKTTADVWMVATEEATTPAEEVEEEVITVTSARPPFKTTITSTYGDVAVTASTTEKISIATTENTAPTRPEVFVTSAPITTTSGATCVAKYSVWTAIFSLSIMLASVYIL